MQRFNTFNLIHKSLRAMLYDTALKIQQTDFTELPEAETTLNLIEGVIDSFEHHAHHEDHFIQPAIAVYAPEVAETFEKEHVEDERLGNALKHLVNIYRSLELDEERFQCGSAISRSFIEFMIFNLQHMAKEEQLQNGVLWKYYNDEEIMSINQKIIATIAPEAMMEASRWMMRGINNADAIGWLKGVKLKAPEFVYNALIEMAKNELPADRLQTIMDAIEEEALVA